MPLDRSSVALSATDTASLTPSNDSAEPNLPAVLCVAPEIVPLLPLPLLSPVAVPVVSLKPQAPTRSALGAGGGVGVGVGLGVGVGVGAGALHELVLVVPVASAAFDSLPAASTAVSALE